MRNVRPHKTRTTVLSLVAGGLAVTLAGCGSSDPSTVQPPAAAGSGTTGGIVSQHNDADVTFINDMTPHHKGAIAMASLAADRAANAQVKSLASAILQAQEPELKRMQDMANAWGVPAPGAGEMSAMPGMNMGGMGGMDTDAQALTPLKGAAFDKEFLTRMIAHHQGAVQMSQQELANGRNPQAKQLAQQIIDAQNAEIATMQKLLPTV